MTGRGPRRITWRTERSVPQFGGYGGISACMGGRKFAFVVHSRLEAKLVLGWARSLEMDTLLGFFNL